VPGIEGAVYQEGHSTYSCRIWCFGAAVRKSARLRCRRNDGCPCQLLMPNSSRPIGVSYKGRTTLFASKRLESRIPPIVGSRSRHLRAILNFGDVNENLEKDVLTVYDEALPNVCSVRRAVLEFEPPNQACRQLLVWPPLLPRRFVQKPYALIILANHLSMAQACNNVGGFSRFG